MNIVKWLAKTLFFIAVKLTFYHSTLVIWLLVTWETTIQSRVECLNFKASVLVFTMPRQG